MQKIMEPIFEIGYLLFAMVAGVLFLLLYHRKKDVKILLLGLMTLLLGVGDAFHLIPRMIGLLSDGLENHTISLGLGKLLTSLTMTAFYILFYLFFVKKYEKQNTRLLTILFCALAFIRVVLVALPQNGWFEKNPSYLFAILRNIPFCLMGALFIVIAFRWARGDRYFKLTYILVFFSFLFYMGTVLFASKYSWTGLLMLPKTVCYIWIIANALRYAFHSNQATVNLSE